MTQARPWSGLQSEVYSFFGRNPKSNRLVVELATPAPDHVILDVGCGPGAAVRAAAPRVQRAVGVDSSTAMIRIATRRSADFPNVEYHLGSAEELPFAADTFDRVWTVYAFHHWSDQSAGIAEARRVLRPGGWFVILERRSRGNHGLTNAAADALTERLVTAGFGDASVARHHKQLVITAVG